MFLTNRSTAIFLSIFIGCVGLASAQPGRNSISGMVLGTDRRPVANVWVELSGEFSTIGRTKTDGTGRFVFRGLGQGRFTLRALPLGTGYMEQSVEVEIAGLGVNQRPTTQFLQQDIYLRPEKRNSPDILPLQNSVLFAQEVPAEAERLYKSAMSDLETDRVQNGIDGLEKALAIFPTYFVVLQQLGTIRINQGQFENAEGLFKRAVAINEKSSDSWYGIAYSSYSLRKFESAASAAEKSAFYSPESLPAYLVLGMAYRGAKDFPKAEDSFKKAIKINSDNPDVHWELALLYGKDMNRPRDAAKELETYLKLVPDAPNKEDVKKLINHFKEKAK